MMNRDDILIEVDQLMSKLDDGNLRIYDASMMFFRQESDPTAYEEYVRGCIPNAAFFDHEVFSDPAAKYGYTVLPEPALFDQIGKIGIGAESEVVLYGNFLPSATRAWWILHYAGHDHVRILNGGLTAWRRAGVLWGKANIATSQRPLRPISGRACSPVRKRYWLLWRTATVASSTP